MSKIPASWEKARGTDEFVSGGDVTGIDLSDADLSDIRLEPVFADPGTSGKVGQVINFGRDEEEKYVLFPSVVDLVEWLAAEYESKRV